MKAEIREQFIVIGLSREETFSVQAGRTIGDRPSITLPESKIEVAPLSAVQEDDSLRDQWSLDRLEIDLKASIKEIFSQMATYRFWFQQLNFLMYEFLVLAFLERTLRHQ